MTAARFDAAIERISRDFVKSLSGDRVNDGSGERTEQRRRSALPRLSYAAGLSAVEPRRTGAGGSFRGQIKIIDCMIGPEKPVPLFRIML